MNTKPFLLPLAAVLALASAPVLAQHGGHEHGAMQGDHAAKPATAAHGIAEGTVKDGVRTVEMQVTRDGFVPAKVKVKKGEKVRLLITRKIEKTCATEIVIPDHGINQPLPLEKAVAVELTPARSGEIHYACAMGHVGGVLFVP